MKIRLNYVFGCVFAIAAVGIGTMQAQTCSTATNKGRYLVVCDGYLTPAPNAPMVPAKILSVATSEYSGQITATGTVSIGGQIITQTVSGTETVRPDCTGTVTYSQTLNGQPGPPVHFAFVISEFGNRIDGIGTDPGSVLSCVLTRQPDVAVAASKIRPSTNEIPAKKPYNDKVISSPTILSAKTNVEK